MNNQAAQTMPAVEAAVNAGLASYHGVKTFSSEVRLRSALEATARAMLAALSQTAGVAAEKIAPVQGYTPGIPWSMHMEAYDVYCQRYGKQPALIDLEGRNCRGGFGTNELDMFIPGWRDRLSEFNAMKARIAELEAMLAAAPAASGGESAASVSERDDDDPMVEMVARAIAVNGVGRAWDDFKPINAFDLDQSDMRDYAKAAIAALEQALTQQRGCATCGGRGEIGGHVGQTAETFDYVTEPCPECTTPQPGTEALRELVQRILNWQPLTSINKADRLYQILMDAGLPFESVTDELESLLGRGGK